MKILHTADWHLGAKLAHYDRLPEQIAVLEEIVEIADREQVDMVLIAGDLFDTFNPGSAAEDLLYRTLVALNNGNKRAVVAIAGNHDSPEKVMTTIHLARSLGILLVGLPNNEPDVIHVPGKIQSTKVAAGFIEFTLAGFDYPVRLITTPYANDVRMRRHLGREGEQGTTIEALLQDHWAEVANTHCDDQGVNLLVAHQFMMRRGGEQYKESDGERTVMHVGGTMALHTDIIPPAVQYVALGHLHRCIQVQSLPMPVVYSSSPLAYSFSEDDQTKCVAIVEVEPAQPATVRFVPLTKGKKLYRKTFDTAADAVLWLEANQDCLVEVLIRTKTSLSAAEVALIKRAHAGVIGQPIPLIEAQDGTEAKSINDILAVSSLGIQPLFEQYYRSVHQKDPNTELLTLFNELLATETDQ